MPGETRSLGRARLLAAELGVSDGGPLVLTVVGSKGKGTAATYASAYLASAGLRTVTVTSPGLRGIRDRIRCQGRAVSDAEMTGLAGRLSDARARLPGYQPSAGYLSPSGLFIIAGMLHAQAVRADAVVLEAGMGGVSDEVSLFNPAVVGITKIFAEHLGVLGDTPADIARDKAGVVTAQTRAAVSLPQEGPVAAALSETVVTRSGSRISVEFAGTGASGIPARLLPASFGRANAELGCVAAQRLLDATGAGPPAGGLLSATLSSVVLPGRWSWHTVPQTPAPHIPAAQTSAAQTPVQLFADSAISRAGVCAALLEAYRRWDEIDRVLMCMPDHKDVAGAITELGDLPVTYVRLTDKPRLTFTHAIPPGWEAVDIGKVDHAFLAARGPRIVALGTVYFIARMLALADVDTERLFTPPGVQP